MIWYIRTRPKTHVLSPAECYLYRITEKKAELGVRLTTVAQTSFDIKSLALTQGLGQFDVACCVGLIAVPGSQGWKHFIQNGGLVQPLQMPTHCALPPTFLHCTQLPENCKLWAHLGMKSLVWRVMFSSWEQTRQQQGWLHVTLLWAPKRITLRTCRNNWCLSSDSLETEPETGFNWKAVYWDGNNVLPKHKIGYRRSQKKFCLQWVINQLGQSKLFWSWIIESSQYLYKDGYMNICICNRQRQWDFIFVLKWDLDFWDSFIHSFLYKEKGRMEERLEHLGSQRNLATGICWANNPMQDYF